MILYLKKARELLKKFIRVQVRHFPRVENSRPDALEKLAITSREDLDRLVLVEHLPEPSVNVYNEEVSPVMFELSWMDPIWDYLVDGILPSDPKEASKLRTRSDRFTIQRGTLYKRGFSTPILKCVRKEDANYVLREVHEGICGNHIGARSLTAKTLRQGYYWITMLKDDTELVKKMQDLSRAWPDLSPPFQATDLNHKPLAFSTVGAKHIGAPTHWEGPMQVYYCRSGLLHQVGRGRAISNNHRAKDA